MQKRELLPEPLYAKIHASLPITCVDLVIVKRGRVLLVRRLREPAKNEWWFPGGRLLKNEEFAEAAERLADEELGVDVVGLRSIGVDNLMFKSDPFGHGRGTHTVSILFSCRLGKRSSIKLNRLHSEYIWCNGVKPKKIDLHLRKFICKGIAAEAGGRNRR
jgi:colanic acid biosynthesis protein WcaH